MKTCLHTRLAPIRSDSFAMNKAEEVFRTYFATTEDMQAFMKRHKVLSFLDGDSWGKGSCELSVANDSGEWMVYEDKPSRIYVMPAATWFLTISWLYPNGVGVLHRKRGPAFVNVDFKAGVLEQHYEDGVKVYEQFKNGRVNKAGKYYFRGVLLATE